MRASRIAGLLLVLATLAATESAGAAPDPATAPVKFVGGIEAGRARAKERGVPILAYVHSADCPVCAALDENVFRKPESGRLEAACVAVVIDAGEVPPPEAAAFMTRYDVRGYPALLVLDADGHLVVPAVGRTLPEMLAALGRVPAEQAALAEARRGAAAGDAKPLLDLLWRRMAWDELLERTASDAAADPTTGARVATALLRVGRKEDSRAAWRRLGERFPSHEDRPEWLVRAIMCDIDSAAGPRAYQRHLHKTLDALQELAEKAAASDDRPVAARAWLEFARLEVAAGIDFGALSYFDKAIAAAPGTRFEATALWERHTVQFRVRRYADAKASCERIVKEFPASPESKLAPAEIEKCDEMLGR